MIKFELNDEQHNNLRVLVLAGIKSPMAGEDAVMAGAQLLQVLAAAKANAVRAPEMPKANGAEHNTEQAGA